MRADTVPACVLEHELTRLPPGTGITFVFNHEPKDECGLGDAAEVVHFHGCWPELDESGRIIGFRIELIAPSLGGAGKQR